MGRPLLTIEQRIEFVKGLSAISKTMVPPTEIPAVQMHALGHAAGPKKGKGTVHGGFRNTECVLVEDAIMWTHAC
jgi:hypothetical protein